MSDFEMDDAQVIYRRSNLYDIFNNLGYSKVRCEQRIKIYDNASKCFQRVTHKNWKEPVDVTVLGSRSEGLAISFGSDMDILYLQSAVMCFENFPRDNKEEIDKYRMLLPLNYISMMSLAVTQSCTWKQ
jgi:hypothetical protein